MKTRNKVLAGICILSGVGIAANLTGYNPITNALTDKTDFTVSETNPACTKNVISTLKPCSFETNQGTFRVGNIFTLLAGGSENPWTMYDKLAPGKSYQANHIGRVIIKLEPKP
jgi:hypothetical protein